MALIAQDTLGNTNVFNFDQWIIDTKLHEIKQCFIDYDMTTLNTLNIRNENYSKLIGDPRVLSNAHLSIHVTIHKAIVDLELDAYEIDCNKLIVLTSNEQKALKTIASNIKDLQEKQTSLKTAIYTDVQNMKEINSTQLNEHKLEMEQKIDNIADTMNKTFDTLKDNFNKIKTELYAKINKYENEIKRRKFEHEQQSINIDQTLQNAISMIDEDIKCYNSLLTKCKDIATKYNDEQQSYSLIKANKNRVDEILKLGTKASQHFIERMTSLNNHENILNEYINNKLELNDNDILINIDENMQQQITQYIQQLVEFKHQSMEQDTVDSNFVV